MIKRQNDPAGELEAEPQPFLSPLSRKIAAQTPDGTQTTRVTPPVRVTEVRSERTKQHPATHKVKYVRE